MPTNYSGRVAGILFVLLLALYLIFPPSLLMDRSRSGIGRTAIKPGIDMVGGVSLIYEIKSNGGAGDQNLAAKVADSLKRRVDPNGVRNLVWRPEGATRLEIQMPLSAQSDVAPKRRKAYTEAQQQLAALNVNPSTVLAAVEKLTGKERADRLAALAMDSARRTTLFKQLSDAFDQIQTLKSNPDKLPIDQLAIRLQPAEQAYDDLKAKIEQTNVDPTDLESILELVKSDPAKGQPKLQAVIDNAKDFPRQLDAVKNVQTAFGDYDQVRNSITDATDLKRLLHGSGVLEFHILADAGTDPAVATMNARMEQGGKGPNPQPGDTTRWYPVDKVEEFDRPGFAPETREWNGKHYMLAYTTAEASMNHDNPELKWGLENARAQTDPSNGNREVAFSFDSQGSKLFGDLTTRYQPDKTTGRHYRLGIVLDDKLISAPNLNSPITGGNGVITGGGEGGFAEDDLNYLVNTFNAGSLPAQLSDEPISEQQVGSTLGSDNLKKGLVACAFGLVVVGIFLVSYYYLAGLVAFLAVLMNLVLILGAMCALGATFTLPSIAGIVLTIGTAVDANVLIFERLREEQHRGLGLKLALRNSYDRARSAILDSNATTVITSLFLYWFGSEEVKGFGLTLLIGIAASLFTALFVTKTVFAILIDKFGVDHLGSLPLSLPKLDKALKPDWDWMGKAWIFYTFSTIAVGLGLVLFGIKMHQGKMWDIEFASGTSVQFALRDAMPIEDVRKLVDAQSNKEPDALPSPSVVSVGNDNLTYEVVTPNVDRVKVKDAVVAALGDHLKTTRPSNFDLRGQSVEAAMDAKAVLPIVDGNFSVDGQTIRAAADHVGGAAVVLRHLDPPLKPEEIKQRLDDERLTASGSASAGSSIDYAVQSLSGGPDNAATADAVVIAWDPAVAYAADADKWRAQLAGPVWKLVDASVARAAELQKENNFDPQVAGEMQRDALLTLICSVVVIMIYIWFRFGNLKYATATVVALLHDTIFTIAAMGFAHYLVNVPGLGRLLELEPFRINLTVVAGILTIMGYSMIDTIVVFDRIRENRGRLGHLDRQVINDAINQTLSRTLLTAGTTTITVAFMYFLGGAGIHGFTFVLLIGILVGTYSSVAIAAPILLLGAERERAALAAAANPNVGRRLGAAG